jgi:hypothetical protein
MNTKIAAGSDQPAITLGRDRAWSLSDAIRDTSYCRPIRGYTGYFVTRDGLVISAKRKRLKVLEQARAGSGNGYHVVCLFDGRPENHYVHTLVIEAFGPLRPSPAHICLHLDDDRDNNVIENLIWGIRKDVGERRRRRGGYQNLCGEAHPGHKLTESEVLTIHRRANAGGEDQDAIAADFNISQTHVSQLKLGHAWKHVLAEAA